MSLPFVSLAVIHVTSFGPAAIALAFAAGLFSFLSPCILPLLPVYLSYISGVAVDELDGRRLRVVRASLLFVAGFSLVFVLLGAGAGGVGHLLLRFRQELTVAAGAFIAVSGLVVAGFLPLPKFAARSAPRYGTGALLTGMALALGWTPCVGYVLGGILGMAASGDGALSGAFLLLVYSLGLGLPFVLSAVAFAWMSERLAAVKRHYRTISVVAGILLVVCGVLMMFGLLEKAARLLPAVSFGGL